VLSNSLPAYPNNGLTFDSAGNLYGTSFGGGAFGDGTAFELMHANGNWSVIDLHDFSFSDGSDPNGGMIFDANGNLYGTSEMGGIMSETCYTGCGTVWEITPQRTRQDSCLINGIPVVTSPLHSLTPAGVLSVIAFTTGMACGSVDAKSSSF
jgi:uncharacterized repeat protein (TIGR03803 family)